MAASGTKKPIGKVFQYICRRLQCQPGFVGAAGTDQRQQADFRTSQFGDDGVDFGFASDKHSRLHREIVGPNDEYGPP